MWTKQYIANDYPIDSLEQHVKNAIILSQLKQNNLNYMIATYLYSAIDKPTTAENFIQRYKYYYRILTTLNIPSYLLIDISNQLAQ